MKINFESYLGGDNIYVTRERDHRSNIHPTIQKIRGVSLQLSFMPPRGRGDGRAKRSSSSKFFPLNRDIYKPGIDSQLGNSRTFGKGNARKGGTRVYFQRGTS